MAARLLIRGAKVLTMDSVLGDLPKGDVLVGGRVLKEGGKLCGIEWPNLRDRLRASGSAIRARASEIRDEGLAAGLAAVMYAPPRDRA